MEEDKADRKRKIKAQIQEGMVRARKRHKPLCKNRFKNLEIFIKIQEIGGKRRG